MFSQTTEYALRAMACLALAPNQLVPTTTLASMTQVPPNYLAKVLQQLASVRLITGRRGVGGGYKLAKPAADINLLDVVQAVGHLQRIHTCPLGLANQGTNLCPLHRQLDAAAAAIMKLLDGVTLQSLVGDQNSPYKPLCDTQATVDVSISGSIRARQTAPVKKP